MKGLLIVAATLYGTGLLVWLAMWAMTLSEDLDALRTERGYLKPKPSTSIHSNTRWDSHYEAVRREQAIAAVVAQREDVERDIRMLKASLLWPLPAGHMLTTWLSEAIAETKETLEEDK